MLRHQFIIDCCRQKGKSNFINFFLRKGQTNLTKFQVWNRISNKIYFVQFARFITKRGSLKLDAGLLLERRRLKSWLKIGIQIFRYRWHGDQVWPKGAILQWRVSLACVWVPLRYECLPMGVSSHIDWNEVLLATSVHVCMYACLFTPRSKRPHVATRISWEQKRRESAVNRRVSDRWHARHRFSTVMVSGWSICHVLILARAVDAERATVVRTYLTLLSATIKISILPFHRSTQTIFKQCIFTSEFVGLPTCSPSQQSCLKDHPRYHLRDKVPLPLPWAGFQQLFDRR